MARTSLVAGAATLSLSFTWSSSLICQAVSLVLFTVQSLLFISAYPAIVPSLHRRVCWVPACAAPLLSASHCIVAFACSSLLFLLLSAVRLAGCVFVWRVCE